ncbi:glycosyltransferase [Prochlorothrix hollandica]|uniref:glycosyltransferase n=1 Tax=Prochlorothrix hollandica TaxID=1223 RepID=UPI000365B905|nr:glycosyltransferase [Prochlorothrix hollandica]
MDRPRVALVHDTLQGYGDPERVLEALHHLYPQAPVYTAYVRPDWADLTGDRFTGWDLRPLGSGPGPRFWRDSSLADLALPDLWESLDLNAYDLVISSTWGGLSHGVRVGAHTLHLCYCHSPDRRRWNSPQQREPWPWERAAQSWLRRYDFYAAQRVDHWITNSHRVARRLHRAYRRSADVIPPPVPVQGFGTAGERYYLYIGDLDRRQQVDVLIQACNRLKQPLQLVGSGPDEAYLRQIAGATVEFLGVRSTADLLDDHIYANAMALVLPTLDLDFSFIALESMGRGLPIIAYRGSGMAEILLDYRTGLFFADPTVDSLGATIEEFSRLRFLSRACIDRAQEFAEPVFASKFDWYVAQALDEFRAKPGLQKPPSCADGAGS